MPAIEREEFRAHQEADAAVAGWNLEDHNRIHQRIDRVQEILIELKVEVARQAVRVAVITGVLTALLSVALNWGIRQLDGPPRLQPPAVQATTKN